MALGTYQIGQVLRIDLAFEQWDADAGAYVAADPSAITVQVEDGAGDPVGPFTLAADQVKKTTEVEDDGLYYLELPLTCAGDWYYNVASSGAFVAIDEPTFKVRTSRFSS